MLELWGETPELFYYSLFLKVLNESNFKIQVMIVFHENTFRETKSKQNLF